MSKLIDLTTTMTPNNSVILAKKYLGLYRSFEEGCKYFILICFAFSQMMWVFQMFYSISTLMSGKLETPMILKCLGSFAMANTVCLQVFAFTSVLDEGYQGLEILARAVRTRVVELESGKERRQAHAILQVNLPSSN